MGFGNQFKYLLYRNFLLKKRNYKQTLYEAISVLYFIAILALVRKFAVRPKTYKPITDAEMPTYLLYQSKNAPRSNTSAFLAKAPKKVGYVFMPGSNQVASQRVIDKLLNVTADYGTKFQSYSSESALESAHKRDSVNLTLGFIVKIDTAKNIVDYTIKVPYKSVPLTTSAKKTSKDDKCRDPRQLFTSFGCPVNLYYSSTYATFQSLVDGALIEVLANTTGFLPPKTTIKMFPKAEYQTDLQYLKTIVSIYMVMAFSPYIMYLLTHIVTEKEKKIKEAMRIMGLSTFVFWLSWFITYAVVISVGVICTTVIAKVSSLFGESDYFIIFIIFFLYGLSLETFAFVLTPLFKVGRTAGGAGSFAALLLSLLSLLHVYLNTSNAVKWVTGLLSPVALSLALIPTLDTNSGTTWSNVATKGEFPTSNGIILLFIDTVLYLLLAMYLDTIFPGEYGQRKHPLFFLKPSFWRGVTSKTKRAPSFFRGVSVKEDEPQADVEEVPQGMQDKLAISIRRLEKVFKRGKEELKALDGVSLDVYEGQITALLGQNGAGKSTLIAALTGMLPATRGSALVYGHSIRISEDMDKIREMIGLCPQQNIIFEELTPREHLKIFAGIKGIPDNEIDGMVEKTLKEIDLFDKGDSISKNLSGGQKRKLCVGIALIGDPKVVFLDEPTSGMDPSSRRYIWSLLQSKKEDRVIFLTTHFMDEADILADYKAVMAKGKLRCAGSSLFLKSRFGVGYYISMVTEDHCDRGKITDLVTSNVSGAEMSRVHGKELSYRLPMKSVDQFPALFAALENENNTDEPCSAPSIGVASYGVSMTTLEEVFLKLDDSNEIGNGGTDNEAIDRSLENLVLNDGKYTTTENVYVNVPEMDCGSRGGRFALLLSQMIALIQIKALIILRSPMAVIFQIVIPPIFTIVGLILMGRTSSVTAASVVRNLPLPPSMYLQQNGVSLKGNTEGLFQNKTNVVIGDILNGATAEKLKYAFVNSVANAKRPHDLGFEINKYDSVNGQADYQLRYNDSSIYSIPVGLNTISNIMLRVALQKQGKPYNGRLNPISASSRPFESLSIPWSYDSDVFNSVLLFSLTFAIMPLGFAIMVVRYRKDGIRHQLRVSGVSRWVYWLHFFIADLTLYIFPVVLILILIPAFDVKALNNPSALGSLFLLLLLYNPTSLVFSYLYSFAFTNWHTMQNVLGSVQIIFTIGPFAAVSVVDMVSGGIEKSNVAHIMHLIFLVIDPMYSLAGGLYYIARVWRMESLKAQDNNVKIPASKYFELSLENGFPSTLICLTIQLLLFSYLVAVLDQWKAGGVRMFPLSLCGGKGNGGHHPTRVNSSPTDEHKVNDDVKQEINKVRHLCQQSAQSERAVVVEGLKKEFGTKRVVDDLNMDVEHNEIFGLLGPNGAGKTTALSVMTADCVPTAGEVYLGGHSIKTDLAKAFYSLGYCPQADTIWETITLKEHLKCFAIIKGMPRSHSADAVRHYMDALRIGEHADTKAKELSGGTKRKLCFLISMCGSPNVVLMDEPSTGMDPSSKRFLWNVISANITGERGAILTTHSMEEADALCSRVGILVKGQLKCIGTTQALKSNYGGGYSLEVKAMINDAVSIEERMANIESFVHKMFPNAIETERFGQRFMYKIPKDDVGKLSDIFAKFEEGKRKLGIEEYSFSQATLEQVFLEFAREQDEDLSDKDEEVAQSKRGSVPA